MVIGFSISRCNSLCTSSEVIAFIAKETRSKKHAVNLESFIELFVRSFPGFIRVVERVMGVVIFVISFR